MSTSTFRMVAAGCIGGAIIAAAFFLRGTPPPAEGSLAAVAVSTREFINPEDSDGDGVSDWQQTLTARRLAELPTLEVPDDAATGTPQTITDSFARSFFESYVRGSMIGRIDESNVEEFLGTSILSLEAQTRDELITQEEVIVGAGGAPALRAYGNNIAALVARHSIDNESEVAILQRALQTNDPQALADLAPIAGVYRALLRDTLLVPAPPELVFEHVALVNSYQAVLHTIEAMQNAFSDPVYALVRMRRYPDDATALYLSYANMLAVFEQEGVTFTEGEPGMLFSLLRQE